MDKLKYVTIPCRHSRQGGGSEESLYKVKPYFERWLEIVLPDKWVVMDRLRVRVITEEDTRFVQIELPLPAVDERKTISVARGSCRKA